MSQRSGVTLTGISKAFGARTVLQKLDLSLAQGELLCLLGPSGCGKTTLLRILAGFETPNSGSITINGQDVTQLPPNKRRMGMVFQAYSLFPNMTALQNVCFGPRVRGNGDRASQTAEAERLLAMVGLAGHTHKFPYQLSGGQQQRVALGPRACGQTRYPAPRRTALRARCQGPRPTARRNPPHPAARPESPPSSSRTTRKRPSPSPTASP